MTKIDRRAAKPHRSAIRHARRRADRHPQQGTPTFRGSLRWRGDIHRTLEEITDFEDDVEGLEVDYSNLRRFTRAAHKLAVYVAENAGSIINYGERYRGGERISTAFVESTVNTVIGKRFAKKQQMQWTPRGAHLLLQTRTRALDGTLRAMFKRCYPGLANDNAPNPKRAAAA